MSSPAAQVAHSQHALLLATSKAAEIIGMSQSWLEHDRMNIKPTIPFVKIGRRTIRYRMSALLDFAESLQMAS